MAHILLVGCRIQGRQAKPKSTNQSLLCCLLPLHHPKTPHYIIVDSRQASEAPLGRLGAMLGASLAVVEVGPAKVVLCS